MKLAGQASTGADGMGDVGSPGSLLRVYRLRSALTQEALAERAGLSRRGVQDLERGVATPHRSTVERLVEALALTADEAARLRAVAVPGPRACARTGSAALRHNLPAELTSFIGREQQLADLLHHLEAGRLLTLTGVGGVGKTRLALRLAAQSLGTYADGVWLVELAPVMDPDLMPRVVAEGLGVRERPGRALWETLLGWLQPRQVLLVLDNCEHLLGVCADLVAALLQGCPRLRVLATSREPLGVAGELVWSVPPLAVPASSRIDAQALQQSEAVQLLLARARARQPGFALTERNAAAVAGLCRRLDGIPLALELVAPRMATLGPEHLLARLGQSLGTLRNPSHTAPPRQATLRGTLQWSYDLLPQSDQALFRRLSAFVGTWTVQAAEAVCGLGRTGMVDVLGPLSSLIDKSLLIVEPTDREPPRYRLLEVMRQFAADILEVSGEAVTIRDQHARHFLAVAERLQPRPGPFDREPIDALERDYPNLLAALDWLIEREMAEESLRLGAALVNVWVGRGHLGEGLERFQRLLRLQSRPTAGHAAALRAAGRLAWARGDYHARRRFAEQSLAAFRQLGDAVGIGLSLQDLASVAINEGKCDEARAIVDESLALWQQLGDRGRIARSQQAAGHLAREQGQFAAAWSAYEASLAGAANRAQYGNVVTNMGWLAFYEGDLQRARTLAETGHRIACELREVREAAVCLTLLARIAFAAGDTRTAFAAYHESLSAHMEFGNDWGAVLALAGIAEAAAGMPDHAAGALRLASAATALRTAKGRPLSPVEQMQLDRGLAAARKQLSSDTQLLACSEGGALTLEQAVADAQRVLTLGSDHLRRSSQVAGLSRRERQVAALIAQGLTNREIADDLVISVRTADTYVERILNKLGLRARSQVAAWAAEHHLVP